MSESKVKRKTEKKSPESDNSLKPKEKWELWLGLGNLIVTIIIGLGVAVFLNYRNEKTQLEIIQLQATIDQQLNSQQIDAQKQLIELQAENERKSKIANIEITEVCAYFWGCDGVLQVRNLGPADASNLRIILHSPSITESWLPIIKDMNAFSVRIPSPLVDFTVTQTTVDSLSSTNIPSSVNAFEIVVKNLKAEQSFLIVIKPSLSLPLKQYDIRRHVTIHKTENLFYLDSLRNYFNQQYSVARFNIDSDCGNCVETTSPGSFMVSSVENWHWEYVSQSEKVDELNIPITYFMPEMVNHTPETGDLDLEITSQYGAIVLQKVNP